MSALAALLSLVAAAAPAPVTLTVHYSDGSGGEHVAHLRCRGDSARADGFLRTHGRRRRLPPRAHDRHVPGDRPEPDADLHADLRRAPARAHHRNDRQRATSTGA